MLVHLFLHQLLFLPENKLCDGVFVRPSALLQIDDGHADDSILESEGRLIADLNLKTPVFLKVETWNLMLLKEARIKGLLLHFLVAIVEQVFFFAHDAHDEVRICA